MSSTPPPPEQTGTRPGLPSARPTILVVDDDCDVRNALTDLLEDAGFRIICKPDGREALSYLRRQAPPAAVLLDLFMPEMNGWEFMRRLRSSRKLASIPVIMVTGNQPHWGYPVPDRMVLRKPVDPPRLIELVREVLEGSSNTTSGQPSAAS